MQCVQLHYKGYEFQCPDCLNWTEIPYMPKDKLVRCSVCRTLFTGFYEESKQDKPETKLFDLPIDKTGKK